MSCARHDWELTGVRIEAALPVIETCTKCAEQRERSATRRAFGTAVIDRAKNLARRNARGRQARLAFKEAR